MEERRKDARREPVIVDLEALVPEDHLLRKIERVMDYEWLYALLSPYYCHDNGRPGIDPVVLIKMVLIQHLFGIASLRQTYREIQVNVAYRWFLGYGLLEQIPHFATVSYAFCKRFPDEVISEIFEHMYKSIHVKLYIYNNDFSVVIFRQPCYTKNNNGWFLTKCRRRTLCQIFSKCGSFTADSTTRSHKSEALIRRTLFRLLRWKAANTKAPRI